MVGEGGGGKRVLTQKLIAGQWEHKQHQTGKGKRAEEAREGERCPERTEDRVRTEPETVAS